MLRLCDIINSDTKIKGVFILNTRQQDILVLTERYGEITIKDLANQLNVTEMTIHRDLDYLQEECLVYKKRGAAVFVESDRSGINFYSEEKKAIGKKAASMLNAGQSVIFDNSTTAAECAKYLDSSLKLTCYTTSLEIARIIANIGSHIIYCSGGYYFPESHGFVGKHAEDFVDSVKADVAIVGASGISFERGISNPYPMHSVLQNKIINSAEKCILLADHSKFDRTAIEKTCDLSDIDMIITDSGINSDVLDKYKEYINLIITEV